MPLVEVITAATVEPITIEQAMADLRETDQTQEARVMSKLKAAREWVENETRRKLVTQTLLAHFSAFDQPDLLLPYGPVVSIDFVKYYDGSNVLQTQDAATYETDLLSVPARIRPISSAYWPQVYERYSPVQVQYVVGTPAAAISDSIKNAILLKLSELYDGADQERTERAARSLLSFASPVL